MRSGIWGGYMEGGYLKEKVKFRHMVETFYGNDFGELSRKYGYKNLEDLINGLDFREASRVVSLIQGVEKNG